MNIPSFMKSNKKKSEMEYDTLRLEKDFSPRSSDLKGKLLKIKPYKENEGIDAGANLLQTLHDVYIENGENKSDSHAFEVWFDKGRFKFRLYAGNPRAEERFKRRIDNVYNNSEVESLENCEALPELNEGYYVSGVWLDENRHTFIPIRNKENGGFLQDDPYSDILGEMSTLDDSVVVLQVVFKAARPDWTENGPDGRSVDEVANELREGHVESLWNWKAWLPGHEIETYDATEKEKRAANLVQAQRGKQAFHVDIRVLAASPIRREAIERARGVSRLFTNVYSADAQQRLITHPVEPDGMEGFLNKMDTRKWIDHEMILSLDELAGIAHIPNEEVDVPQIKWKTTKSGSDVDADSEKDIDERDHPEESPLAQTNRDRQPSVNLGPKNEASDERDSSTRAEDEQERDQSEKQLTDPNTTKTETRLKDQPESKSPANSASEENLRELLAQTDEKSLGEFLTENADRLGIGADDIDEVTDSMESTEDQDTTQTVADQDPIDSPPAETADHAEDDNNPVEEQPQESESEAKGESEIGGEPKADQSEKNSNSDMKESEMHQKDDESTTAKKTEEEAAEKGQPKEEEARDGVKGTQQDESPPDEADSSADEEDDGEEEQTSNGTDEISYF